MTNKELVETAKGAMKDLWELNHGRLLEHEQTAYNCLRLFCERLPLEQQSTIQKTSSDSLFFTLSNSGKNLYLEVFFDKAAADKAAADKAAADKEDVIVWCLSEKERQIIQQLG